MSHPPFLRRLFAGGSTPARAIDAAAGPARVLESLVRGPSFAVADDSALAPLVRASDPFASLGDALGGAESDPIAARDPGLVAAGNTRLDPDTVRSRRDERPVPPERRAPRVAPRAPNGRSLAAAAADDETTARRVAMVLADVAPEPQPLPRPARSSAGQSHAGRARAVTAGGDTRAKAGPRAPRPSAAGEPWRARAPGSAGDAESALRQRAGRSGALDELLAFPPTEAAVCAILDAQRKADLGTAHTPRGRDEPPRDGRPRPSDDEASVRPSMDARPGAGDVSAPAIDMARASIDGAASLSTLARVLDRQRPRLVAVSSRTSGETPRAAEPLEGLRGLVARFAAQTEPPQPRATVEPPHAPAVYTAEELPASFAERLGDERLVEHIDRVLRAEARRHGIDLEGVAS
jgi:hypothetical protein